MHGPTRLQPQTDLDLIESEVGLRAQVLDVEANRSTIGGMMLSGGELLMYGNVTDQGGYDSVHGVQLDAAGRPAGPQTYRASLLNLSPCLAGDVACPQFEALGDGGFAYLSTGADGKESVHVTGREPNSYAAEPTGASGGRIGTPSARMRPDSTPTREVPPRFRSNIMRGRTSCCAHDDHASIVRALSSAV